MNKFCRVCGSSINEGEAFCKNCGAVVNVQNNGNLNNNVDVQQNMTQSVANNNFNYNQNAQNNFNQNQQSNVYNQGNNSNDSNNGLKVASLVLGIISLIGFGFCFPLAIIGLILGIVYKSKSKNMCAGIILNAISLVISLLIVVFFVTIVNGVIKDLNDYSNDYDYNYDYDNDYDYDYDYDFSYDDEDNTREGYQRVGNEEYGYIDIPDNWVKFYDVSGNDTLQYSYANIWILTMYAIESPGIDFKQYGDNLKKALNDEAAEQVTVVEDNVGNYDAYKISGYYSDENIWLVMWTFEDEYGTLHYIAIEGPDKDSEHFDLIDTFSVNE